MQLLNDYLTTQNNEDHTSAAIQLGIANEILSYLQQHWRKNELLKGRMGFIFQKMDRHPAKISFKNDGTNFASYNVKLCFTYFKLSSFGEKELNYEVDWSFSQVIVHKVIMHEIFCTYYVIYSK